ncbi:MAG: hypothetical protein ACTSP3_00630 [Candidatus Heimdallarchaeaceae archaeon]
MEKKIQIYKGMTEENANVYYMSNGTIIQTLMNLPKSRDFFQKLKDFADKYALGFQIEYNKFPFTYGQVVINEKIVFLDYIGEENKEFKYLLSNVITPNMIERTIYLYNDDDYNEIDEKLKKILEVCGKALDYDIEYSEIYSDDKKFYQYLSKNKFVDVDLVEDLKFLEKLKTYS